MRASGRSEEATLRTQTPRRVELLVSASLVMLEDKPQFLLRLRPLKAAAAGASPSRQVAWQEVMQRQPDGFVVTDPDGRVLLANPAFVELTQMAAEDQLQGQTLDRWLGRPGVDLSVMLATLRQQRPDAQLLAGATDIGLWVNKQLRHLPELIDLGAVAELKGIETRENGGLWIGAGASLEDAWRALVRRWPTLADLWLRFAAPPVRHAGTVGGNIANGSPIGDGPVLGTSAWWCDFCPEAMAWLLARTSDTSSCRRRASMRAMASSPSPACWWAWARATARVAPAATGCAG